MKPQTVTANSLYRTFICMYGRITPPNRIIALRNSSIKYLLACVCKSPDLLDFFFGLENGGVGVGEDSGDALRRHWAVRSFLEWPNCRETTSGAASVRSLVRARSG